MCHQGSGDWGPQESPQLHPLCRVASWMRVRKDPSLVDHPPAHLCGNLTPSNHQQTSKTIRTQNCPPGPPPGASAPRTPGPNTAPSIAAPKWGGSWLVTPTVLGDEEGAWSPYRQHFRDPWTR